MGGKLKGQNFENTFISVKEIKVTLQLFNGAI